MLSKLHETKWLIKHHIKARDCILVRHYGYTLCKIRRQFENPNVRLPKSRIFYTGMCSPFYKLYLACIMICIITSLCRLSKGIIAVVVTDASHNFVSLMAVTLIISLFLDYILEVIQQKDIIVTTNVTSRSLKTNYNVETISYEEYMNPDYYDYIIPTSSQKFNIETLNFRRRFELNIFNVPSIMQPICKHQNSNTVLDYTLLNKSYLKNEKKYTFLILVYTCLFYTVIVQLKSIFIQIDSNVLMPVVLTFDLCVILVSIAIASCVAYLCALYKRSARSKIDITHLKDKHIENDICVSLTNEEVKMIVKDYINSKK